jgi:chaperonin cofactor prefoldin
MALITQILIKTGLMRSQTEPTEASEAIVPLVVHVADLSEEALSALEADGLVQLDEQFIEPLDGDTEVETNETRVVHLRDLMAHANLTKRDVDAESELATRLGLDASVEDVLAASDLQAEPGEWSIDRALKWLKEHRSGTNTSSALARAFKAALAQAQITESRVFSDAALRDKAVDTYEALLKRNVTAEVATLTRQRKDLQQRMGALQKQINGIVEQEQALQQQLQAWCVRKAATEAEWVEVINLLIPGAGDSLQGGITLEDDT